MVSKHSAVVISHYLSLSNSTTQSTNDSSDVYTCVSDANNIHERIRHISMIPVVILILVTNFLILAHSVKTKRFRRPCYWFIACLCAADLSVGAASLGTIVTNAKEPSLNLCLVRMGLVISSIVASIFFLLAIAIDRFLAITNGLNYSTIVTSRRSILTVVCVSILSLLVGLAPLTGWNAGTYNRHCSFAYVHDPGYIVFLLTFSLLPILTIFLIYLYLYKNARLHIKRIQAINALHQPRKHSALGWSHKDWRCFRQLVYVVGCLMTTWTPFLTASFFDISSLETPCWLKDVIGTHFLLLGMTNSIFNPVIYTVKTREFRNSWKQLCFKTEVTPE